MLTIGIDIDDTITNTNYMVKREFKKTKNPELIDNADDIIRGNYVSETTKKFYKSISNKFANDIKIRRGAVEAIKKLKEDGHKIIIITARDDNYYDDAYKICHDYLTERNIEFDKLLIGRMHKLETCKEENVDILIDDSIDVINEASENGIDAILITALLNKGKKCNSHRFNNWSSIYKYITRNYTDKKA